jgi:hypothetical protein
VAKDDEGRESRNQSSGEPERSTLEPEASAATKTERLEDKVEAIRDDLGDLVGELDRRRHRAVKPLVVGTAAIFALGIGGYVVWRLTRSRPSRLSRAARALRRATDHPERVATQLPNGAQKIIAAATSAVVAALARRATERWNSTTAG